MPRVTEQGRRQRQTCQPKRSAPGPSLAAERPQCSCLRVFQRTALTHSPNSDRGIRVTSLVRRLRTTEARTCQGHRADRQKTSTECQQLSPETVPGSLLGLTRPVRAIWSHPKGPESDEFGYIKRWQLYCWAYPNFKIFLSYFYLKWPT